MDSVEEGGDGGGVDVDVAGGAGDVEGVGLVGVEGEVELRGEVRHETVKDGLGWLDGCGRRGCGGLGGCGDREEEGGATGEPKGKHVKTIPLGYCLDGGRDAAGSGVSPWWSIGAKPQGRSMRTPNAAAIFFMARVAGPKAGCRA